MALVEGVEVRRRGCDITPEGILEDSLLLYGDMSGNPIKLIK